MRWHLGYYEAVIYISHGPLGLLYRDGATPDNYSKGNRRISMIRGNESKTQSDSSTPGKAIIGHNTKSKGALQRRFAGLIYSIRAQIT